VETILTVAEKAKEPSAVLRFPRHPQDYGHEKCFLYAIQSGAHVKVGLSRNVRQRLNEMELLNPVEPRLALYRTLTRNIAPTFEKRVHELLAGYHYRREWFTAPISEIRLAAKITTRECAILERADYEIMEAARSGVWKAVQGGVTDHAALDKAASRAVRELFIAARSPSPTTGR
jgi:hypothetical protein